MPAPPTAVCAPQILWSQPSCHSRRTRSTSPAALRIVCTWERVQREVERRVPGATRCIGYGMPAFRKQRIFLSLLRSVQEAHRHLSAGHRRSGAHRRDGTVSWREGEPVVPVQSGVAHRPRWQGRPGACGPVRHAVPACRQERSDLRSQLGRTPGCEASRSSQPNRRDDGPLVSRRCLR